MAALGSVAQHPNEPGVHHLHGDLCWTIDERRVPSMESGDPGDVCLGMWWDTLEAALAALTQGSSYRYDPILQGIPAFLFEREDSTVRLSLVASATGTEPVADWQRVPFEWRDFVEEVHDFQARLREQLRMDGPTRLPDDWAARLSKSD
ncbi:hypothetical protein JY651_18815 [Pyxidicoccus parkwayensis]|uniref:Uncharacterized protein n=1 Tax=Pyxidicoccus parkwayensis TaxID=2813578 RepID=A0ABX7P8S1_9BACT|nr:hypothetical protein [Pyxidicoccus parkwaysis]QSQ26837.1 hypothetical protein JY651_18815 [Pyxidicoccus parkwaysis]